MATAILFIGFGEPRDMTTPEKTYGWLATEAVAQLRKHEGKSFERMEPIGLTPHGGDLSGCIILFGERAKLDELRRTDEFEGFVMELNKRFRNLGVVPGINWEGIQGVLKRRNIHT
jgi:hypothetical protein